MNTLSLLIAAPVLSAEFHKIKPFEELVVPGFCRANIPDKTDGYISPFNPFATDQKHPPVLNIYMINIWKILWPHFFQIPNIINILCLKTGNGEWKKIIYTENVQ